MPQVLNTDVLIIGGGVAGLWLNARLRQQGYSTLLVERGSLGGEQSMKSQGIIHGGAKYALHGALTGASEAIADMPAHWRRCIKGEGDVDNIDILGNTTESAIQATKQALYNLDHPLEYVPKCIEVQRACMKEREFYVAFLERLEKL